MKIEHTVLGPFTDEMIEELNNHRYKVDEEIVEVLSLYELTEEIDYKNKTIKIKGIRKL